MSGAQSQREKELAEVGEKIACEHLRKKGHTVLHRRYRYDRAEVDIVSETDGMLVFTEVKTRESCYLTEPLQLVPQKKQRQLIKAADGYLKERNEQRPSRFDIMIIVHNTEYTRIEHIEDAFFPTI
jgi:putative endonuclease